MLRRRSVWHPNNDLEDEEAMCKDHRPASRNGKWLLAKSQKGNGTLSSTAPRNQILPTTWMSLEANSFQEPPDKNPVWPIPCEVLSKEPGQACSDLWENGKLINGCVFLSLFVIQQPKTSTCYLNPHHHPKVGRGLNPPCTDGKTGRWRIASQSGLKLWSSCHLSRLPPEADVGTAGKS